MNQKEKAQLINELTIKMEEIPEYTMFLSKVLKLNKKQISDLLKIM